VGFSQHKWLSKQDQQKRGADPETMVSHHEKMRLDQTKVELMNKTTNFQVPEAIT